MPAWEKIGSSLRPKIRKVSLKNGSWPHRGGGGKRAQELENGRKIAPKWVFGPFFLFLGRFSAIFAVRPNPVFGDCFPILGRRPEPILSQAGMFATLRISQT